MICLQTGALTFEDWLRLANLRNVENGLQVLRRLLAKCFVRKTFDKETSRLELTDYGLSRFEEFRAFWSRLVEASSSLAEACWNQKKA
jgi:hypothetical protein